MVGEWIDRGDLWRNKALSLQHRLRDRFRVVVDRHRHRPRFSDGYFSKMERWLRRFRSFRKDTLPSTAAFYRKRGRNIALWNYQLRAHMLEASRPFNSDSVVSSSLYVVQNSDAEEDSVITRMLQAVPVLGNVCHVFMHGLNRVQIYSAEKLQKALVDRPEKQPLLTVSNHVASMDDPLVIASLLPPGILLDAHKLRWTLCATDRCFRNPVSSAFFRAQVVGWPPVRSFRKNTLASNAAKNNEDDDAKPASGCVYVKVSMDGAPYLRKVDLKTHSNYSQLSWALEKMFSCFTIGQCSSQGGGDGLSERHLKDLIHGSEYVLTYEDKDGDWMLVGDVPWEMFTNTCKRLRIMKGSEAIGLAPRAMEKCKSKT